MATVLVVFVTATVLLMEMMMVSVVNGTGMGAAAFVVLAVEGTGTRPHQTTPTSRSSISNSTQQDRRRKHDACVEWQTYYKNETSIAAEARFLLQENDNMVVRTERQVACRVLLQHQQEGREDSSSSHSYYEFGTAMNISAPGTGSPSLVCRLHCNSLLLYHDFFEIAVKRNEARCDQFHWAPQAYDVDPLGPNIVRVMGRSSAVVSDMEEWSLPLSNDIAICRYQHDDGEISIGRMLLEGPLFGHCGYLSSSNNDNNSTKEVYVGGNFHVLSAIPRVAADHDDVDDARRNWNTRVTEIQKRVGRYVSEQDRRLIASISGHSVQELLDDLNNTDITSYNVLARFLSTDRFIPHDVLNEKGLSLLRAVLAEQMTLARRRHLGLHHHPDTVHWERDGMLLKDFDYYTDEHNQQEFEELLQMVAASKSITASSAQLHWVERNVTSVASDPQLEPHIDTFHSVVKMWVYERGVVTNETGPLHYMLGSHQNTRGKLQWMYNMSLPPATEAIKEPSLRFRGHDHVVIVEPSSSDTTTSSMTMDSNILQPVLPLDCYHRTLVIADMSGIHHRGHARPGTVRTTLRVSNGNDGGLPRLNPYVWDGWGETISRSSSSSDP